MTENDIEIENCHASLQRRIAAMIYDSFLVFANLWLFSIPVILIKGDIITSSIFYQIYLFTIWFLFYGWFWVSGGQTLGMKAWKIYVCKPDKTHISWRQAGIRFVTALLGLANISILFSKNRLAWHERLSHTRTLKK